jgi:hypothetical protein
MSQGRKVKRSVVALDDIIEEIIADTNSLDEVLSAFQAVLDIESELPCEGRVIGEPVSLVAWEYDGNELLGLRARCRRKDGNEYLVSAWELELADTVAGVRILAAYRRWLGLKPPPKPKATVRVKKDSKASESVENVTRVPIDLAVLAVRQTAINCRVIGSEGRVILRSRALIGTVPGMIITVNPEKQWVYGGHDYLSGDITASRFDVKALGLEPLKLKQEGIWDPEDLYCGDEGPSIADWTMMLPVNARGRRNCYEMEQVLPGLDPVNYDNDPIIESNELKAMGDLAGATKILMNLCLSDLRCLDAHAHLGNLAFERWPEDAILHYEVGVRVGELTLGDGFEGVLPWTLIDNRPFMRCMQGYGLCLWRLGRFDEAGLVFKRMLLLNPSDNQGIRFLIDYVAAKEIWREDM